jgi:hypothetical protein
MGNESSTTRAKAAFLNGPKSAKGGTRVSNMRLGMAGEIPRFRSLLLVKSSRTMASVLVLKLKLIGLFACGTSYMVPRKSHGMSQSLAHLLAVKVKVWGLR